METIMATVLITGANRGLGLEFCRQYAEDGWEVIACCRDPGLAKDLARLVECYPAIQVEALDVGDFAQIDALATKLSGRGVDVLINNAGVYRDKSGEGFGYLDYQAWADSFRINAQAPVKMTEAFLPHLKAGNHKLLVAVSSLMGSMADNTSGGSMLYRTSKAALNAAMKTLAIDLGKHSIGVLTLHPGWVKTDMGGPNALIGVAESVAGMRAVIAGFSLSQSGCFVNYSGKSMPW